MNVERKFTALKSFGRQCPPLTVYRKAASDLFKPCHFYRVVSLFLIPALTSGLIASDASTPVVIGPSLHVFRRQLVTVFAVIRQRLVSNMFRSWYSYRPVSQLFRLNRGVGLSVALAAERNQVAQVVRSVKSSRNLVMDIQEVCPFLKLPSTVLALVAVAQSCARGLARPVRSVAKRGLSILMNTHADGLSDTQCVCPTGIGAVVHSPNLRQLSLKYFQAVRALQSNTRNAGRTLTLIRTITGRSITMIGKVLSAAMQAVSRRVSPLIAEIAETRAVFSVFWFPRNGLVANLAKTAHFHGHFTKITGEAVR